MPRQNGRRCREWPVLAEYIRPNEYPRKSNSPSGTLQICVFSSLTVSFSFLMISRSRCKASSALTSRQERELAACRTRRASNLQLIEFVELFFLTQKSQVQQTERPSPVRRGVQEGSI